MNNIKWEDGAVCFAAKKQWNSILQHEVIIDLADFQLNEMQTGDYIKVSELDTEQKYNDAVEVLGLFGFEWSTYFNWDQFRTSTHTQVYLGENRLLLGFRGKRKLTYTQLMTIGKLKRAMIERDSNKQVEQLSMGSIEPRKQLKDGNKYHRTIYGLCGTPVKVDVYRVSDAFPTGSAPIDHAVKKMLCAGLRGHKDKLTDIDNAIESLQAARLLLIQKGEV
ncbi:ATPase [Pseudoalteromonas phage BS5]|uniref:ATPase n=1 Tax=Pseudoalteromonas phage BS5 TaxID=1874539 RepID=UPI000819887E|nr:ATPase [Pseudoalteromonas phage BS5]ANY29605.1 terminase ATPase subunit [Pseudoalteromonas phage BS5]